MRLNMLLEVLRSLEGLSTEVTLVRLQGDMNSNVRRDVISLDRCRTAITPGAGQVQVVSAFATDMAFADMFLWREMVREGSVGSSRLTV